MKITSYRNVYFASFILSYLQLINAAAINGKKVEENLVRRDSFGNGRFHAFPGYSSKSSSTSYVAAATSTVNQNSVATGITSATSDVAAATSSVKQDAVATGTTTTSTSTSSSATADSSCTLTGSSITDLPTIISSCTNIVIKDLTVPAGTTLDMLDLQDGTTVTFDGTTTFEYSEWDGPLIYIGGTDVTITGTSDHVIDGNGEAWWDGLGSNGGVTKPLMIYTYKMYNSLLSGLNIKNSPRHIFSINNSDGVTFKGLTIDDTDGDVTNGGHNTDGFDIGSSNNITIDSCKVYNQDDCLAINSGTNITFSNNYCSGGHGISIAVGGNSDNVVDTVTVSDCEVVNSANGIRIKTVVDATGSVNNINYSGITITNATTYGIAVQGDYKNSGPTGTATGGVPVTDLTIKDVTGTVQSTGADVYILVENASDWSWSDISITGGEKSVTCSGIPSGSGASC